jgi:hypothetical protein
MLFLTVLWNDGGPNTSVPTIDTARGLAGVMVSSQGSSQLRLTDCASVSGAKRAIMDV